MLNDVIFSHKSKELTEKYINLPSLVSSTPLFPGGDVQQIKVPSKNRDVISRINQHASTTIYGGKKISIITPKNSSAKTTGDFFNIGTIGYVSSHVVTDREDIILNIFVESRCFITSIEIINESFAHTNLIPVSPDKFHPDSAKTSEFLETIKKFLQKIESLDQGRAESIRSVLREIDNNSSLGIVCDLCCNSDIIQYAEKEQKMHVLFFLNVKARANQTINLLKREIQHIHTFRELIEDEERKEDKQNHEAIIKKHIKILQEKLDYKNSELNSIAEKIEILIKQNIPEYITSFLDICFTRLKNCVSGSSEYSSCIIHINTLLSFPWNFQASKENCTIQDCKRSLHESLYGMNEIKSRILNILSFYYLDTTCKIRPLCIVGNPGTGKTSLAYSIAKAFKRKLFKISLCGLSEESFLKGTRQTYVGSACGKIVQSMILTKSTNPVILLDEIDKISFESSNKIWTSIIDIIDPTYNHSFIDCYMDCNIDLSKVFFIATANDISNMPNYLIDRMECLFLQDYTEKDKISICKKFIIPKINKRLPPNKEIRLSDKAISYIVKEDRNISIRKLETKILSVIQKHIARHLLGNKTIFSSIIKENTLKNLLIND